MFHTVFQDFHVSVRCCIADVPRVNHELIKIVHIRQKDTRADLSKIKLNKIKLKSSRMFHCKILHGCHHQDFGKEELIY